MDRIELKGMQFYGHHGLFQEEKKLGQKFVIDVTLHAALQVAGKSDDMDNAIDYGKVYEEVRNIVTGPPRNLIESVGEHIATSLLHKFSKVQKIEVSVKKPEAPIPGILDYAAVHLERSRDANTGEEG